MEDPPEDESQFVGSLEALCWEERVLRAAKLGLVGPPCPLSEGERIS